MLQIGNDSVYYGLDRLATDLFPIYRQWHLHDALGSTRQTVIGGGTLNAGRYDPWGTPIDNQIAPFGFAGELQGDGGLVYLRARWYTPQQGVFTSRDPFAGWAARPYSQHYFQYGYSNPVLVTDPSGRAGIKGAEKICPFGTRWDPVLEDCLPNPPVPPPTNPAAPERPQPVDPREPLENWSGGGRRDTTGAAAPPIPIPGIGPQAGGRTGGLIGRLILIGVIACAQMLLNEGVRDQTRDRDEPGGKRYFQADGTVKVGFDPRNAHKAVKLGYDEYLGGSPPDGYSIQNGAWTFPGLASIEDQQLGWRAELLDAMRNTSRINFVVDGMDVFGQPDRLRVDRITHWEMDQVIGLGYVGKLHLWQNRREITGQLRVNWIEAWIRLRGP